MVKICLKLQCWFTYLVGHCFFSLPVCLIFYCWLTIMSAKPKRCLIMMKGNWLVYELIIACCWWSDISSIYSVIAIGDIGCKFPFCDIALVLITCIPNDYPSWESLTNMCIWLDYAPLTQLTFMLWVLGLLWFCSMTCIFRIPMDPQDMAYSPYPSKHLGRSYLSK